MRKEAIKFFAGMATGAALTVAARKFMYTRTGRVMRQNLREIKADFYKSVSPKLKEMKYASEEDYKEFIRDAAEKYAKIKKISSDMTRRLVNETQNSWDYFSEYFNND
jgi:gas vesicle protein